MMTTVTGRPGDSTLRLRDGRRLQVLEIGKKDGFPIFHFHGNGSSRLEIFTVQSRADPLGIRLICPDRPGIGGSDSRPGYQLLDWPDDVVEVADQLGIERYAVEGFSGGAPFALACAYKIPHRLLACVLISPATGPFMQRAGSFALRSKVWMLTHVPWLVRALVRRRRRKIESRYASHTQDDKARHQEIETGSEGKIDDMKEALCLDKFPPVCQSQEAHLQSRH
jgi:pimeloyl-ACP methyl ester carboxylesterase